MNHRVKRNLGLVLLVLVLSLLVGIVALELGALDRLAIRRVQKLAQDQKQEWRNHWLGIPLLQYPSDLFTYQELIASVQPDVIIETGTYAGGSAVYFSMLLDFIKPAARVVTIDISPTLWQGTVAERQPELARLFARINFVEGGSTEPETLRRVSAFLHPGDKVLVLLDSAHSKEHVLAEIKAYAPWVTVGSYIVVTDTHLDGTHWVDHAAGPMAATREFLATHPEFQVATEWNRYFLSACPRGFLRRVR
jgi:cephalosporin hydroxylase